MLEKLRRVKAAARLRPTNPARYLLALDIGTEYVKALIGRLGASTGDQLTVVGVGRCHQNLTDMQAGAIADIGAVVANCDKALNEAEAQAGVSVRTAVIGIAGELVKGATAGVRCTRTDPQKPLDALELEKIISLVQQRAEAKTKRQLAVEVGGKPVEVRLINSAIVGMEIDGYKVTNPLGFQGRDVFVRLYTAFAPLIHIGALERVAAELDLDLLAVAAEPFAVARAVIGDNPAANMDMVVMDVGGGTTDLAVIDGGGVQGTKMFGIGGRVFTRSIGRALDIEFEQAERLKLSTNSDKLPPNQRGLIRNAINATLDVWLGGVELALAEFDQLEHLPAEIMLCGGGSSLDMLVERLSAGDWYRQLPFTKRPAVHRLRPDQVVGIIDGTGRIRDHTLVTAMGLLRVGLDSWEQSPSRIGSVKEKINRMLRV